MWFLTDGPVLMSDGLIPFFGSLIFASWSGALLLGQALISLCLGWSSYSTESIEG